MFSRLRVGVSRAPVVPPEYRASCVPPMVHRVTGGEVGTDSSQLDRGTRQALVELAFGAQRPPVVQKDFERAPQGDPADDQQALAQQAEDAGQRSAGATR